MTAITTAQIAAIHTTARRVGLSETERRNVIAAVAGGKTSCKALTSGEALRVLDALNGRGGAGGLSSLSRADKADGPWRAKLQALWLSGWHLGVFEDRRDSALHEFVKRQTDIDHTRFLIDATEAAKVIEGLKAQMARKAGVRWPKRDVVRLSKEAVLVAQRDLMQLHGVKTTLARPRPQDMSEAEIDAEIRASGPRLRKALKGGGNGR